MDVIEQWPIAPIAAGASEIKVKPQMAQPGGSKLREPNPAHMLQIGDLRGCVTRCLAPADNVAHCPAGLALLARKIACGWPRVRQLPSPVSDCLTVRLQPQVSCL